MLVFSDNRGFMTQNGQPDNPRSARYVLKDFVNGKLLYCVAPPNNVQSEFHTFPPRRKAEGSRAEMPARAVRASRGVRTTGHDVDKLFFQQKFTGVHVKGVVKDTRNINRYASKYAQALNEDSEGTNSYISLCKSRFVGITMSVQFIFIRSLNTGSPCISLS